MTSAIHVSTLERQVNEILNSQMFTSRDILPSDGPGVYIIALPDGRAAYIDGTDRDQTWGEKAGWHFKRSPSSPLLCNIQNEYLEDRPTLEEVMEYVKIMNIKGIVIDDPDERLNLQRYLRTRFHPIYGPY